MGQRSQVIIRVPKTYYGEGNPNNRPPQVFVLHNQWLYGETLVIWTAKFLRGIKYFVEQNKSFQSGLAAKKQWIHQIGWMGQPGMSPIESAMNFANSSDLQLMTRTHPYNEDKENENDLLRESVDRFMDYWDNNDGYLFVEVNDKGEISYALLNHDKKLVDPQTYLTEYEVKDMDARTREALTVLLDFKQTDALESLEKLRRLLFAHKV
jgi:hypothetical protein